MAIESETHEIVGVELTRKDEGDSSQGAPLLAQIDGPIGTVIADSAYEGDPTYQTVAARDKTAAVVVPPKVTAVLSQMAETTSTQRDHHIKVIAEKGRMGWQKATGYGRRAMVETAMGRYKGIIGAKLHARSGSAQKTEAAIAAAALNRMIKAGRPDSVRRA